MGLFGGYYKSKSGKKTSVHSGAGKKSATASKAGTKSPSRSSSKVASPVLGMASRLAGSMVNKAKNTTGRGGSTNKVQYSGPGQGIYDAVTGLSRGETFEDTLPFKSFFDRGTETGKVRTEYEPYRKENIQELTEAKNIGSEQLGTRLGASGVSGGGGTAKYQGDLFDNRFARAFRDLGRQSEDQILTELARRESRASGGYGLKQSDFDPSNYLTYQPSGTNLGKSISSVLKNILN